MNKPNGLGVEADNSSETGILRRAFSAIAKIIFGAISYLILLPVKAKTTSGTFVILSIYGLIFLAGTAVLIGSFSDTGVVATPVKVVSKEISAADKLALKQTKEQEAAIQAKKVKDEFRAKAPETLRSAGERVDILEKHLDKYYASANDMENLKKDGFDVAMVSALYAESKDVEELKLSSQAAKLIKKMDPLQRRAFVSFFEENAMKTGMNLDVSAGGKDKKTLRIEYVLMNKVTVYQFQNDAAVSDTARRLGFTKVVYTDGYNESWTVAL